MMNIVRAMTFGTKWVNTLITKSMWWEIREDHVAIMNLVKAKESADMRV